ncbi:ATP-dependent Clp protease adaptor ClpS [Clostridium gasigenes]|uniref:ATP-dependent Clp protease adaptor ClpS n=1 Tax=Clostridium gasigenes TaxID=94869 RepID=UPI001C0DCE48|nr:ATP-dependent Clp protease adaptor ClpS [Clostridium gasigenes]MBU3131704.1 ATP-dependent Clp protease adaptor ClpS [Clostridium gasigenes]
METNTIIVEKNKIKIKKPKHYKVVMYNDDFTTMEFVVSILIDIFKKNLEEANKVMIDVHKKGKGIAGIYPYDIAVSKLSTAMRISESEEFPLKLAIEEV